MQEDQEGDPGDQHKKWHQKMTVSHDRLHATKKIHLKPFHLNSSTIKSKRLRWSNPICHRLPCQQLQDRGHRSGDSKAWGYSRLGSNASVSQYNIRLQCQRGAKSPMSC